MTKAERIREIKRDWPMQAKSSLIGVLHRLEEAGASKRDLRRMERIIGLLEAFQNS